MSEDQLSFHYFRMYDTNKDHTLDGVEIIHAMTSHWDEHEGTKGMKARHENAKTT